MITPAAPPSGPTPPRSGGAALRPSPLRRAWNVGAALSLLFVAGLFNTLVKR